MAGKLRIAIGQMVGQLNQTQHNIAQAGDLSIDAAKQGAKLILFPEGCLNGNALQRANQETLPAAASSFISLQTIANKHAITLCIGFTTPIHGDQLNNAHAIIRPNNSILFQYKGARSKLEPPFLAAWPNPTRTVFLVDGFKISLLICCEYGLPKIETELTKVMPNLILHPSAGAMDPSQVLEDELTDVQKKFTQECFNIIENATREIKRRGIPKIAANPIGFDQQTWWPGNSFAIGPNGEQWLWMQGQCQATHMAPSVGVATITLN